MLLTFEHSLASKPEEQLLPTVLGWTLWAAVLLTTLLVIARRGKRMKALTGPAAAFVLLGAYFSCYHFMYYDVLLAGLPVLLLFTEPRCYLRAEFWPWARGDVRPRPEMLPYYQPGLEDWAPPPMPLLPGGRRARWVCASMPPLLLVLILALPAVTAIPVVESLCDPAHHFPPGESLGLLLLWAWCGYRVLIDTEEETGTLRAPAPSPARVALDGRAAQFAELGADVGSTHQGLADQHGANAGRL